MPPNIILKIMPISEVYNEDCFETLKRIESGTIDLILQDTPFGCTQNKWDIKPDLQRLWPEWLRVAKENAAIIFFATQPFASELIFSNKKMFRYDLIWEKSQATGFLNANKMPLRNHEYVLIFYKKLPTYNPQIFNKPKQNIRPVRKMGKSSNNYGSYLIDNLRTIGTHKSYPASIIYFENEQGNIHPTQKPIDLITYLIKSYSNEHDFVFDGYLGSGTTRVAAYLENRNFIGAESDNEFGYFKGQEKRFKEQTMQIQIF